MEGMEGSVDVSDENVEGMSLSLGILSACKWIRVARKKNGAKGLVGVYSPIKRILNAHKIIKKKSRDGSPSSFGIGQSIGESFVSPSTSKQEEGAKRADDCSFIEVLDPGVDSTFRDKDLADYDWGDQIEEIEDGFELAEEKIEDLQVLIVRIAKNLPTKLELKELPTTLKYVYLSENETYSVIVALELKNNEEERLI
ncbi:hypothetical protein LWI28_027157 [Acer negundo]|uniref:Uncharacterized protein n=1 Tax=Acer negundo TaxID=4023 RepID=A0AAD5I8M1_ACENE|nr:hypothetical protein LWI28_027157 [Acer negundo]